MMSQHREPEDSLDFPAKEKPYIYVASSWRNERQHEVVVRLRAEGFGVYDFRKPNGGKGFSWDDAGMPTGAYDLVFSKQFIEALDTDVAKQGFQRDFAAMEKASIFVMVLPCERDAHLELGWAAGAGKETIILLDDPCKPSLMYGMVDHLSPDLDDLVDWLEGA